MSASLDRVGLREIESTLPPGFRFYPSDEELVCHYLYRKVRRQARREGEDAITMVEVDLHTREPWELPDAARFNANEWYFFSFRDRKYATGSRTNRATRSGYWKATGKDRTICDARTHAMAGMRKTLVFYLGRAPNGIKTPWVMHEFRIETPHSPPKEDWVLCRVFHKRKGEDGADGDNNNNLASSSSYHDADMRAAPAASCLEQQLLLSPSLMELGNNFSSTIGSSIPPPLTTDVQALLQCGGLAHHEFVVPASAAQDMAAEDQLGSWMQMMAEQLPRWQ